MNEQKAKVASKLASSQVIEPWKCPKCGANNKFNPNICTSCNYSKIPPIQVLPPQSRKVWEKLSFILVGMLFALQLLYIVTMANGSGLSILYDIDKTFLAAALECPDMILYSHLVTAGVCLVLTVITLIKVIGACKDTDKLAPALHFTAIAQIIAVWTFPVVNIATDMIVTSIKVNGTQLRSSSAYDVFDMGLSIVVPIVITVICAAIIYVNKRLAPSENEPEEE